VGVFAFLFHVGCLLGIRSRDLTGLLSFLHCREVVWYLCRDCTTNHTMLDDNVSELWRKENVTSGYCPRYRYTLIATLTLGNLYYICVCIFFQQTGRPSILYNLLIPSWKPTESSIVTRATLSAKVLLPLRNLSLGTTSVNFLFSASHYQ
jgi:hypothetical protein